MPRFRSPARKSRLAAIALALATAFAPQLAQAQSDPFALPEGASIADAEEADREGPGLSAARVNGRELPRMVDLRWIDGALAIDAQSAEMAGIPVPEGAEGYLPLDLLDIAEWSFDRANQRLAVRLFNRGEGRNDIDVARRNFTDAERSPILAGLVDYDLFASHAGGRTQTAAFIAPRVSYGDFNLEGALRYLSDPAPGADRLVRLDTAATLAVPGRNLALRAGDAITAGTQSQRALRIGGLQIGTDFALRPDLVTTPMPDFAGTVAVPTTLDLIINDQRLTQAEVEAGDFRVRNIPLTPGRGEVSVVLRDETGRETIRTTRIYVSREMLAKGLWQGAANVGWLRQNYGLESNDYRDLVGTFFLRRGVTRNLSLGVSGEAGMGVTNAGAQFEATVANVAMLFGEMRYSRTKTETGTLMRGGVESIGERISGRLEAILPSQGYRDVASQSGDPLPPRQFIGTVDFDLARSTRIQLTASRQERLEDPRFPSRIPRLDIARAILRHEIADGILFSTDLSYRRSERTSFAATAGLTIRIGPRRTVRAGIRRDRNGYGGYASFYSPDIEPGDIGYAAHTQATEDSTRFAAAASYRARFARFSADSELRDGDFSLRANARGTLILAGPKLYARNQTGGAYALIRTGEVGGVTIMRENRFAGVTDKDGYLLVENVAPLVAMKYDVEADSLPFEAVARSTEKHVVVSRGAVGLIEMDVQAYRSRMLRVLDRAGRPVPIGTALVSLPSGESYSVGFDGYVDINALSRDDRLDLEGGAAGECAAKIPAYDEDDFDIPDVQLRCAALEIASAD